MQEAELKELHLYKELKTAIRLIELGFGELQNLHINSHTVNDFYHLPFQLLSSGFERLMKCHICYGYYEQNGMYPDYRYLKRCGGQNGHDLLELKTCILDSYFLTDNPPILDEDFNILKNDKYLEIILDLLSEFGKYARYYNLDVVTSAPKSSKNVIDLWKKYENNLISSNPKFVNIETWESIEEVYSFVRQQILIKLEKFTGAICRQFTIGKLGEKARQYSSVIFYFIQLKDEDLGQRNYRVETTRYQEKERKVHQRTSFNELNRRNNPHYRHKVVRKEDFEGDWPFYSDEVTIKCYEKHLCVVTIENKDYALNGSAIGRFQLEAVHNAEMAIQEKSVGPFIQMALNLGKEVEQ